MNAKIKIALIVVFMIKSCALKSQDSKNDNQIDSVETVCFDSFQEYYIRECKKNSDIVFWGVFKLKGDTLVLDGPYKKFEKGVVVEAGENKDNERIGVTAYYNKHGEVEKYIQFNNNSFTEIYFYNNGNIERIEKFQNFQILDSLVTHVYTEKNGTWYYYYENGLLKKTESYIIVKVTDNNRAKLNIIRRHVFEPYTSVKDGIWQYFDISGKLEKEEYYVLGELVHCKSLDKP